MQSKSRESSINFTIILSSKEEIKIITTNCKKKKKLHVNMMLSLMAKKKVRKIFTLTMEKKA